MSFIFQLSFIFCVLILFHVINIYYYFQCNKYINKQTEVYNICVELLKTNELVLQNIQCGNILVFTAIAVAFDYFNNPPDFTYNVNNWICILIMLFELRNIMMVNDSIKYRNKI